MAKRKPFIGMTLPVSYLDLLESVEEIQRTGKKQIIKGTGE